MRHLLAIIALVALAPIVVAKTIVVSPSSGNRASVVFGLRTKWLSTDSACAIDPSANPCLTLPYALGIAESGDVIRLNNETNGQEVVYNQTGLPMTSKLAGRHIIIESGLGPVRVQVQSNRPWFGVEDSDPGSYTVRGSELAPIVVEPQDPTANAQTVLKTGENVNLTIIHTEFRNFKNNGNLANPTVLYFMGPQLTLSNCTFRSNVNVLEHGYVALISGKVAILQGFTLIDTTGKIFDLEPTDRVEIVDSQFFGHGQELARLDISSAFATVSRSKFIGMGTCTIASPAATVVDNTISSNLGSFTITSFHSGVVFLPYTLVSRNTFFNNTGSVGAFALGATHMNATISDNVFIDNVGTTYGGTSFVADNGTIEVSSNTFRGNSGNFGGALFASGVSSSVTGFLVFRNNTFQANTALMEGGAIFVLVADLIVDGNTFACNKATNGGAVSFMDPYRLNVVSATFNNNIFVNNRASQQGGAVFKRDFYGPFVMRHNSFVRNQAALGGGAFAMTAANDPINFDESLNFFINNTDLAGLGAIGYCDGSTCKCLGGSFIYASGNRGVNWATNATDLGLKRCGSHYTQEHPVDVPIDDPSIPSACPADPANSFTLPDTASVFSGLDVVHMKPGGLTESPCGQPENECGTFFAAIAASHDGGSVILSGVDAEYVYTIDSSWRRVITLEEKRITFTTNGSSSPVRFIGSNSGVPLIKLHQIDSNMTLTLEGTSSSTPVTFASHSAGEIDLPFGGATLRHIRFEGTRTSPAIQVASESKGEITFDDCQFVGNAVTSAGRPAVGVFDGQGQLTFSKCLFSNNTSGASTIQIEQQAISILNCIFRHNSNDFAGVIDFSKMNQSIASIRHSSFIHNVVTGTGASIGGAALSGTPQSLEVEISKFIGNQATNSNGGAVCLPSISSITIRECEFACNSAGEQGGAIFVKQNPTTDRPITIEQSTFRSNYAMKQGGSMALALAAPTGVVSVVRNNTFDWNWSDGNGGAVFCVAEEPNAALSLADNQFELNVAGGYANSSSHQGAVFFTESCLCRQAATGLPIIPNPSGDVIAIEEGDTDRLCPTVSSRAPSPDLKIFLPLSRCVVDPPPTGGPSVGGIMIPSVGTIEGIMIGVILFELLLLFVLLLVICHRRRKQKLEKQYVPTQPVIATTVSTPQIAEESSSSSQSSSSTEDSGEIGTPLGVVPDSAPTPLVSAAVQKRFREFGDDDHNIRVLRCVVAVIDDDTLSNEEKHSQMAELSEQLILRSDMLVARKSTRKQLQHDKSAKSPRGTNKNNTVTPRIVGRMDFSKMSHDGEIYDIFAMLKANPSPNDDSTGFNAATKKIRNRSRAVIVAYEDRIPTDVDAYEVDSDDNKD